MKIFYSCLDPFVTAPQSEQHLMINKKAAENTNPMNAVSQETPVGDRVDDFLNRMGR